MDKKLKEKIEYMRKCDKSFKLKKRNDRKEIYITNMDISSSPLLNYGWTDEDKSILNPYNNYTYRWTALSLSDFISMIEDCKDINDAIDAIEDAELYEIAESLTDLYISDLTTWLADRAHNTYYLDEAHKEQSGGDRFSLLMSAQNIAITEHLENMRQAVKEFLEED